MYYYDTKITKYNTKNCLNIQRFFMLHLVQSKANDFITTIFIPKSKSKESIDVISLLIVLLYAIKLQLYSPVLSITLGESKRIQKYSCFWFIILNKQH